MLLLGIAACSEDSKYNSSVVKDIQMYLDDEAYSLNTGSSNKPLFIYAADGSYVANYSTLYRFNCLTVHIVLLLLRKLIRCRIRAINDSA